MIRLNIYNNLPRNSRLKYALKLQNFSFKNIRITEFDMLSEWGYRTPDTTTNTHRYMNSYAAIDPYFILV